MFAKLNRDEGRTSYSDDAAPQRHAGLILAALAVIPLVESMNARMNALVMKVADLQNRLAPVLDDAQSDGAESRDAQQATIHKSKNVHRPVQTLTLPGLSALKSSGVGTTLRYSGALRSRSISSCTVPPC